MQNVKCPKCEQVVRIPKLVPGMKCPQCSGELLSGNVRVTGVCSVCGKKIGSEETASFCPACGAEYHDDCWISNDGCATEGCAYVDALKPMEISMPEPTVHVESSLQKEREREAAQKAEAARRAAEAEAAKKNHPRYEGPFLQDPDLMAKLKYYAIFGFGGMMVGLVALLSGWILKMILSTVFKTFFGVNSEVGFYITLFILVGFGAGAFFAHKKMDELL